MTWLMSSAKMNSIASRTSFGTSSRSRAFLRGRMTRVIPARCAASTFALMPPTGSTRPRSVHSPVIAVSGRTRRPVKSDVSAVNIVTPADGPSFGTAPAGTWMCRSCDSSPSMSTPSSLGVAAHVRERRLRRLLHHVAELAGDLDAAFARHARGLDEEDVAADRRPREAGGDAGNDGALGDFAEEPGLAEVLRRDRSRRRGARRFWRRFALRHLERERAAELRDLALELSHAGLARVVADDRAERFVGDRERPFADRVRRELLRDEVPLGDVHLLVGRVAGELDDLETVAQRAPRASLRSLAVQRNITSEKSNGISR